MAKASERNGRAEAPYAAAVPSMEPLISAGNKMVETWMQMGTQMLEFSRRAIDQNMEIGRQMAKSASLNEAMDLQAKFTRTLVQDYLAEANKMADMSTRSLLDSFGAVQESAKAVQESAKVATTRFAPLRHAAE